MKKLVVFLVLLVAISGFVLAEDVSGMAASVLHEALGSLHADLAVGAPVEAMGRILIPLFEANTSFGGGGGGPEGEVWGSGVGGGLNFLPYAVLIVEEKGVSVLPVSNQVPFLQQLVDALPQIIPIVMQILGQFS
ncbi:MAG TPA: spore germination protein GerW family protein [Thermotogota bacterium]|nr:spore germination protein GerW family protein [Thermotogota bacterium]